MRAPPAAAAAGGWTPLSLGSKLLAYASVVVSVTKTGADITQVNDLSGSGYHFVAGGAPQYGATSFNGGPGATFDGVDDFLHADSAAHGGGDKLAGFMSVQVSTGAAAGNRVMGFRKHGGFLDADSDAACLLRYAGSVPGDTLQAFTNGTVPQGNTADGDFLLDTPYRFGVVFDGAVGTLYQNNVAATTTSSTSGNFATTADLLLSTNSNSGFGNGCPMVAQSWIFMKGAPDSTERSNIDTWLQTPV